MVVVVPILSPVVGAWIAWPQCNRACPGHDRYTNPVIKAAGRRSHEAARGGEDRSTRAGPRRSWWFPRQQADVTSNTIMLSLRERGDAVGKFATCLNGDHRIAHCLQRPREKQALFAYQFERGEACITQTLSIIATVPDQEPGG